MTFFIPGLKAGAIQDRANFFKSVAESTLFTVVFSPDTVNFFPLLIHFKIGAPEFFLTLAPGWCKHSRIGECAAKAKKIPNTKGVTMPRTAPLFQPKVLQNALARFDAAQIPHLAQKQAIVAKWQQAIAAGKLEQAGEVALHGDFLSDVFGAVLGYVRLTDGPAEWNLALEQKTLLDATKADGAIGFFTPETTDIRGVIELKRATADLDAKQSKGYHKQTPVEQAFSYAPKHGKQCQWVLVSNYVELRLYHASSQVEYESFRLTELTDMAAFKRFYFLLAREQLLAKDGVSPVEALYRQSEAAEARISQQFYAQYTTARWRLFEHLKRRNPAPTPTDELFLLEKTQKLLDRFIFICFCEDTGMLPGQTFRRLLQQARESFVFMAAEHKIWPALQGLFNALDTGWPAQRIPKFNGELFKPDEALDALVLGDEIFSEFAALADYDFDSELNVNILGHIFEQSISDLEELRAGIRGQPLDRKQGRRKQEGIFYTPEYITRYIVEQAVGGWLEDCRRELGFDALPQLTQTDMDSVKLVKSRYKGNKKVEQHRAFWEAYREKLANITVLDPACGSGAFLNQAFRFLYEEGERVNAALVELSQGQRSTFDLHRQILSQNLYGVDINRESVEITKLSLWLLTARKDAELTALDGNIKCGNSLIDDPLIAGDKAFTWEKEFPEIMQNGGFAVVIGNPPYGATLRTGERAFIETRYQCFQGNFDIYTAFIELAFTKLTSNGYWSYIIPVSWQSGDNYFKVRQYLRDTGMLKIGLKLPYDTFSEAYVDTGIYVIQKNILPQYDSQVYEFPIRYNVNDGFSSKISFSQLPNTYWQTIPTLKIVLNPAYYEILPKITTTTVRLGDITNSVRGILPNKADVKDEKADTLKKYFVGTLYRYIMSEEFKWVSYGNNLRESPKDYSYFCGERILVRRLISRQFRVMATYVTTEFVNKKDLYNIKVINPTFAIKYLLTIINSKLVAYLKTKGSTTATKDDFSQLTLADIRNIPVKQIPLSEQQPFIEKADIMLKLNKQLHESTRKFLRFLESSYHPKKLSNKLRAFHTLNFPAFVKELKKQKVTLSKVEEFELLDLFESQQAQALDLQKRIERTDGEIDRMVYALYGLTGAEIRIVEGTER